MKKKSIFIIFNTWIKKIIQSIVSFFRSLLHAKPKIIKEKDRKELSKSKQEKKKEISTSSKEEAGFQTSPATFSNPFFSLSINELKKMIKHSYLKELDIQELYITKEEEILYKKVEEKISPIFLDKLQKNSYEKKETVEEDIKKEVKNFLKEYFMEELKKQPSKAEIDTKLFQYKKKIVNEMILIVQNENKKEKEKMENFIPDVVVTKDMPKETPHFFTENKVKTDILSYKDVPISFSSTTIQTDTTPKNTSSLIDDSSPSKEEEFPSYSKEEEPSLNDKISDSPYYEEANEVSLEPIYSKEETVVQVITQENSKSKEKIENFPEKQKEIENYALVSLFSLSHQIENIKVRLDLERKKENLEDVHLIDLEIELTEVLLKIHDLKQKHLEESKLQKVFYLEQKAKELQYEIKEEEEKKIEIEKKNLQEELSLEAFDKLKEEIHKIHLDEKEDLNRYSLNKIEDLELLSLATSEKIERELLILRLKKATTSLRIPFLLTLPFMKNRYFMIFSSYMLLGRHLHSYKKILKRKTIPEIDMDLEQIKTGQEALEETYVLASQHKKELEDLEKETLLKFPDLKQNPEFQFYMNELKRELKNKEEKLSKKKDIIIKYQLSSLDNIKRLKRKIHYKPKAS